MRPEVVLKLELDADCRMTFSQIETVRQRWITAYEAIAKQSPDCADLCAALIQRVDRAARLCVERYTPTESRVINSGAHDDYYYEWLEEVKAEEEASLDGDFPLGNAYDAEFATPYFSVEHLARIQCGQAASVPTGHYVEPAYDVLIRKGIIAEMLGDWEQAAYCYGGVPVGNAVYRRQKDCIEKQRQAEQAAAVPVWYDKGLEDGQVEALLRAAGACLDKSGRDYNPDMAERYLRRAADSGNIQAILGMGRLALQEGDDNFWEMAVTAASPDFRPDTGLVERHRRQLAWYKLAAEAGDTDAMNRLCVAYRYGYPVEQNEALAHGWAMKAAGKGTGE